MPSKALRQAGQWGVESSDTYYLDKLRKQRQDARQTTDDNGQLHCKMCDTVIEPGQSNEIRVQVGMVTISKPYTVWTPGIGEHTATRYESVPKMGKAFCCNDCIGKVDYANIVHSPVDTVSPVREFVYKGRR